MAASIWAPADGDLPITTTATTATQTFVATASQTLFTLTTFAYAINTQSLLVFKNGLLLSPSGYTQTSTTSFTLLTPATGGDIIIAYAFTSIVGVAITWKGAYSGAVTYAPGNVVSYMGASYICILQTTGNLPVSVTYWNLLADRGVTGAPGAGTGDMLVANNLAELTPTKIAARASISAASDAGDATKVFAAADSAAASQQVVPRAQADTLYADINKILGISQTWQYPAGRALNFGYTNSTPRPIVVSVIVQASAVGISLNLSLVIASVTVAAQSLLTTTANLQQIYVSGVVPPGASYQVNSFGGTLTVFAELRA